MGCTTLEEMLTRKMPEIGHFHIFGCLTYSHVSSEKRTNLEATVERGIFVGYDEDSKDFCIYFPTKRKDVVRREVIFEEDIAFKRSRDFEIEEQQSIPQVTTSRSLVSQVTGFKSDWVIGYRYTNFRDSVYRYINFRDSVYMYF